MIDLEKLREILTGTVGLYPPVVDGTDENYSDAKHATPIVYLQDAHKLLRPEVLDSLGPIQPEANTLMRWYTRIESGAINKLGLLVAANPPAKPLLESTSLYPKEANLQGALNKTGRFLALRFTLPQRDIAVKVPKVGVQLSGPVANVPMYLFHSEQSEPIKVYSLTSTLSGRTVWGAATEDVYMYSSKGGYYLLGYFEEDLPSGVSAIGAERGWNLASCSTCGNIENEFIRSRSPYLSIEPVYVENAVSGPVLSWAEEKSVNLQSWGINAIIEVECDVTSFLVQNRKMLVNALLHVLACDVLEELSTSDRVNAAKKELSNQAYIALYGQKDSDHALAYHRDKVIKELKGVLEKMRPCCVTTDAARRTIRFENVFD
ncbi:hypothetical protein GCM10027347_52530 [Larkinella harenae]